MLYLQLPGNTFASVLVVGQPQSRKVSCVEGHDWYAFAELLDVSFAHRAL